MQIAITGASGFIGQALVKVLPDQGRRVVAVHHSRSDYPDHPNVKHLTLGDLAAFRDSSLLKTIDCVVHIAGRAHVMYETESNVLSAYREINVEGTLNLARQAATLGVKRFVFLSSIKVSGETTPSGKFFGVTDTLNPQDAYGISKMEAELGLYTISQDTGMEVVCIRPPLVYGPGVKGNFLSLLRWLERGIPLPLGAIHNRRSLVGLDNLIDLIITCLDHPAAANQTFLVSDDEDLSTTELLQRLGKALNKPARLVPILSVLLEQGANLLGKKEIAQRLFGHLQIDICKTKQLLGWSPPVSVEEGFRKTVEGYLQQR